MTQIPITPVQSFTQQVMPYLVMLAITLVVTLIGVIKAYGDKLIAQLKLNKAVGQDAADSAKAALTVSASNALALAAHTSDVNAKLETITDQTNGINLALNDKLTTQATQIVAQAKEISDLKTTQA